MTLQPRQVHADARPQIHAHDIIAFAGAHLGNLVARSKYAFGKEKTHRQFKIVTRGAHSDRDAPMDAPPMDVAAETDFERFLNCQQVWLNGHIRAENAMDADSRHPDSV